MMASGRSASIAGTLAVLLLATDAFGQNWIPTKPVWEQADRVTCREERRYECNAADRCRINTGRAVFTVDFSRNQMTYGDTGQFRMGIEGRAFRPYPSVLPNDPAMSLLMSDGRLFKFVYKPRSARGPYDLQARILGHSQFGAEIEVFELTCARS